MKLKQLANKIINTYNDEELWELITLLNKELMLNSVVEQKMNIEVEYIPCEEHIYSQGNDTTEKTFSLPKKKKVKQDYKLCKGCWNLVKIKEKTCNCGCKRFQKI